MIDFSELIGGISTLSFFNEMEKIAATRGAKEHHKALFAGDSGKAERIGRAEWGAASEGSSVASGLQRSVNRQHAASSGVHMGAGGIDPKAGGDGFAKHVKMTEPKIAPKPVDFGPSRSGPTHLIHSPTHAPVVAGKAPGVMSRIGAAAKNNKRGLLVAGGLAAGGLAAGGLAVAAHRRKQSQG